MHQITLFQDKKSKKFSGEGAQPPSQTPHAVEGVEGIPLPTPYPLGASFKAEGRLVF